MWVRMHLEVVKVVLKPRCFVVQMVLETVVEIVV